LISETVREVALVNPWRIQSIWIDHDPSSASINHIICGRVSDPAGEDTAACEQRIEYAYFLAVASSKIQPTTKNA
jgi:hypothetical protein